MSKLHEVATLGQAIWIDFIKKAFLDSGELQNLIDAGVRGLTSNPAILHAAIIGSTDYDAALQRLVEEGRTVEEIYAALVIDDIQRAADLLRPVYDATDGSDGYVSLEVNPALAHDSKGSVAEARRLFARIDRPNLMIKVPATPAGVVAVRQLIGRGVNVNATLIFSAEQYEAVAQAYIDGLETLLKSGGSLHQVASVASFFVSRIDSAVDKALAETDGAALQGKTAIAVAKATYARFTHIFDGPRWDHLLQYGARVQRPLWASTSTKNLAYPDTLYVDSLIGPDTVNTVPPTTLQYFRDHGTVTRTLDIGLADAEAQLTQIGKHGIDLTTVAQRLLEEGLAAFASAFDALMNGIAARRQELLTGRHHQSAHLGSYQAEVDNALAEMTRANFVPRIWEKDHTVWKPKPTEITDRLGWLRIPGEMLGSVFQLNALRASAREDGYTHAVLLGMGGSSLAPEVFRKTFGVGDGGLDLMVLDSTDPGAVRAVAEAHDPDKTLFVVATKSGGTVETLSFFKYFYNRTLEAVGKGHTGAHFVAITDAQSALEQLARTCDFRVTFLNDPNIGGRYAALSYFGLVAAGLLGVDVERLLSHALTMARSCEAIFDAAKNPGLWLGAILGVLAKAGRDKLTLLLSPPIAGFGDWVEQLIAESTGKEGKGIVPVVGEPLGVPGVYGDDRLFVYMRLAGDPTYDAGIDALEAAGFPVVRLDVPDPYALGKYFFLWELAVAVAGAQLGINPFDQPDVETAKARARAVVASYATEGTLPDEAPTLTEGGIAVYGETAATCAADALEGFLAQAAEGDYIALQAYVQPTQHTDAALLALRTRLRDALKRATTLGYGPRYLHSTGQLHKGGPNTGLFIQLTADDPHDIPIPDAEGAQEAGLTFGVLKAAQAMGDAQALRAAGRRVIRFHLGEDVVGSLRKLTDAVRKAPGE